MSNITQKVRARIEKLKQAYEKSQDIFATEDLVLFVKPKMVRGDRYMSVECAEWSCFVLGLNVSTIYAPNIFETAKKHYCREAKFIAGSKPSGIPDKFLIPVTENGRPCGSKSAIIINKGGYTYTQIDRLSRLNFSDGGVKSLEITTRSKIESRLNKLNDNEIQKAKIEIAKKIKDERAKWAEEAAARELRQIAEQKEYDYRCAREFVNDREFRQNNDGEPHQK